MQGVQGVDERPLGLSRVERVGPPSVVALGSRHGATDHLLVRLALVDERARVQVVRVQVEHAHRVRLLAGRVQTAEVLRQVHERPSGREGVEGVASVPSGSFNLDLSPAGGVLTSSLTNGSLTHLGISGRILLSGESVPQLATSLPSSSRKLASC